MYNMVIPPELVSELYELRENHDKGPIAGQIREAIRQYVTRAKKEIKTSQPAHGRSQSNGNGASQMSLL